MSYRPLPLPHLPHYIITHHDHNHTSQGIAPPAPISVQRAHDFRAATIASTTATLKRTGAYHYTLTHANNIYTYNTPRQQISLMTVVRQCSHIPRPPSLPSPLFCSHIPLLPPHPLFLYVWSGLKSPH